jgi:hypothetical protein
MRPPASTTPREIFMVSGKEIELAKRLTKLCEGKPVRRVTTEWVRGGKPVRIVEVKATERRFQMTYQEYLKKLAWNQALRELVNANNWSPSCVLHMLDLHDQAYRIREVAKMTGICRTLIRQLHRHVRRRDPRFS